MRRIPRARLTITVRFSWRIARLTPVNPSSSSRRRSVPPSSHNWSDIPLLRTRAPGEGKHVRSAKRLVPRVPPKEFDLNRVAIDRDAVEGGGPAPPRAGAERPGAGYDDAAAQQVDLFLVIVPAEHQIRPALEDAALGLPPARQAHAPRQLASQHVVVHHQDSGLLRPGLGEDRGHPPRFPLAQVPLDREVPDPRRERT